MTQISWLTGVIFPYLNFFLFLFLLWRFAKGPANKAAEKRSEEYKKLYEKASASYEAAKDKLQKVSARLKALQEEIKQIEVQAEKSASQLTEAFRKEAQATALQLDKDAQQLARREALRAKELLQEELWAKAMEELLVRVKSEFTVKKQKEFLWASLTEVNSLKK